jgi:hypothetical protein
VPFTDFSLLEIHGLGHGRGKIDIPLLAGLPFDHLDFGWVTHDRPPLLMTSLLTRYHAGEKMSIKKTLTKES